MHPTPRGRNISNPICSVRLTASTGIKGGGVVECKEYAIVEFKSSKKSITVNTQIFGSYLISAIFGTDPKRLN